jgi:hypothetical protein
MINEAVDRFNKAATELQTTEFRRARTPDEWQRMHKNPPPKDYAKLFSAVIPMIEAFAGVNPPSDRLGIAAKLNLDARGILRAFAHSMSVLAVRRASPALIEQGLTALAILGEIDDIRDLTYYLATLHYSAMKLGIDTRKLFGDVASLVPSINLQTEMRGFPVRLPQQRDISAFRVRETLTEEGFDFVQDPINTVTMKF